MKKELLITTSLFVSGILCSQVANKLSSKIPANVRNFTAQKSSLISDFYNASASQNNLSPTIKNVTSIGSTQKIAAGSFTETIIGKTYYDLQSNSSVGDRLVVNNDGSIAAVWTMAVAAGDATYADRGTGYNYYSGTAWGAFPTARLENARVGWGNVVNTRSGKELVLSHHNAANTLNLATRATKGAGAFANSTTAVPSATVPGNFWPRMVNSGDTIYAISVTQQTTAPSTGVMYQGLDGAVCFSRSKDAGVTWDIANIIPTGLSSATFRGFGGDSYAIASRGATVVVVAGDIGKNIVMSKSTDAGATWTAKTVLQFPLPLYNSATTITDINADMVADTINTNDGNFSVAIDFTGKAYVAYGEMRCLCTTPGTGSGQGLSYFPGTDGLSLWNETMPQNVGGNTVAEIQDLYQQNSIYLSPNDPSFGNWGSSLTSYPSMAFDAAGTLYLSYSSIVDSLISIAPEKSVRNVYVKKSTNGGTTWTNPLNVVKNLPGIAYEGIFGSMAKNVNGFVHLIYQKDLHPGNGIPATSGTGPDQTENTDNNNDIVYVKIPVGELDGVQIPNSIKEIASTISNLNFYPNPASTNGTVDIVLADNAKMELVVLNAVGQVVNTTTINGVIGSNKVNVDLNNLSNGLYFYQVNTANSKSITKKFVVSK